MNALVYFVLTPRRADALLLGVIGAMAMRDARNKVLVERKRTCGLRRVADRLGGSRAVDKVKKPPGRPGSGVFYLAGWLVSTSA
jgi:hypothetical protein